jgi:hypothetical protein
MVQCLVLNTVSQAGRARRIFFPPPPDIRIVGALVSARVDPERVTMLGVPSGRGCDACRQQKKV